jgi:hypothetical protein
MIILVVLVLWLAWVITQEPTVHIMKTQLPTLPAVAVKKATTKPLPPLPEMSAPIVTAPREKVTAEIEKREPEGLGGLGLGFGGDSNYGGFGRFDSLLG